MGPLRLIAFCEASADFGLVSALVDRVLRDAAPTWVVDGLDVPESVRTWRPDRAGDTFFNVHAINRYVDELGVRSVRGRFDGRRSAGAMMARKIFLIVRTLNLAPDDPVEAVVLVWDMDHQAAERREGVEVARDEAEGGVGVVPDRVRVPGPRARGLGARGLRAMR
jgi:hypothetical protein